jgi:hypothetical protein
MPKRILVAALLALVCGAFVAPEAFAVNNQAYKYLFTTVDEGWKGSRVTVDNPSGSQMFIQQPVDFDLTSAYAGDNGHGNLIQIGVEYEWQSQEGPSCNLGMSSATLYYFVETLLNTVGNCYNLGTASGGAQNKMSVQRGSDNLWHAYQNGVGSGVSTTWTDCGGNGCQIEAFAENGNYNPGYYYAKFAGSGQTPWQLYVGGVWSTITNPQGEYRSQFGWNAATGPFPGGIWYFYYHI